MGMGLTPRSRFNDVPRGALESEVQVRSTPKVEIIAEYEYVLPPSLQQWSRPTAIEQAISAVTQEDKDCDYHRGAAIVGRKDPCP